MFSTATLPDDPALLKAMVTAQHAEIEHLKHVIAKLRRMHFGQRSEQLDASLGQLEIALEELETIRAERSDTGEAPAVDDTEGTRRPARKPLPDQLPRETVEHPPLECSCPDCGGRLKKFGEDVTETLE